MHYEIERRRRKEEYTQALTKEKRQQAFHERRNPFVTVLGLYCIQIAKPEAGLLGDDRLVQVFEIDTVKVQVRERIAPFVIPRRQQ